MKNIIILGITLLFSTLALSQNKSAIEQSFKKAQANILQSELAPKVELCIGDDIKTLNSSATVSALQKWLTDVKPSQFSAAHSGGGATNIQYYIGDMKAEKGNFRIMIYYNKFGDKMLIDEIRINK